MKRFFHLFIALSLLVTIGCQRESKSSPLRLWYQQPAAEWTEALPVGNGRLGAMVFGNPSNERIQLNEESLWAGSRINSNNPEALESLPRVQQLILDGQLEEATQLIGETMLGTPLRIRSNQTLGDLFIDYPEGDTTGYTRELDLSTGIVRTRFSLGETGMLQEVFASAPGNLIVVRLKPERRSTLNAIIRLERERDAATEARENGLLMTGQINDEEDPKSGPGGKHMRFSAALEVIPTKGTVTPEGNSIRIEGADEALLLFTAATDYNLSLLSFDPTMNPEQTCSDILALARTKSYKQLRDDHLSEYKNLFNRVTIDLGDSPDQSILPTDSRLKAVQEGADDPGLAALYFQYGRYLLMSSSRAPGVLPANLQGVWNKDFNAPWNADFHTNINLQMNYWPAEVCNLPETKIALIGFLGQVQEPGTATAREIYGARGWTLHHLTDPFGRTAIMDGVWGCFPMGGPWMAFQLYEHYAFTGDKKILEEDIYPLMKSSAQFILDFLIRDKEGRWVTAPSNSPENRFIDPVSGIHSDVTFAATMDIQIITELFQNCLSAAHVLETDVAFSDSLKQVLRELPSIKVSKRHGGVQEWVEDYEEAEPGHRHMSHLLGLHPGTRITTETPGLFEAASKTLENRLSAGGGHTGWSRAWIVNFYARLLDGDNAHLHLTELLRKSTLPNLFDTHPPFQIDGNFGGAAGIAEMLIQSHAGNITVLPALPNAWDRGHVTGLLARGGFETDIFWANGKLERLRVHSKQGNPLVLKYGDETIQTETVKGRTYEFSSPDGKSIAPVSRW